MQAEIAAREIDSGRGDPASIKHSLRPIAYSSQRAAHMVNQLLAMARAEDTGQAARREPVDMAAVTRAVVRDFVPRAIERQIDLGYEGPAAQNDNADTRLNGEPVLLNELVRNLVDNALQYTPAGGSVTARVLPDPLGQVIVLQVEDTGPGIAPAEREAVFRPFYRTFITRDGTQVDGSGLGLAIVKEVAQRHGAEITVDDARPRGGPLPPGALVTVRLPRQVPASAAIPG
jgi:two-component system sensor histidine kinase TctE